MSTDKYRRVYHFLKLDHALNDINGKRIKIATFNNMNDPFELQAARIKPDDLDNSLTAQWHEKCGVLCFCTNFENPIMWAHYADGHRGAALGFDVLRAQIKQVRYVEVPETITIPDQLMQKFQPEKLSPKLVKEFEPFLTRKLHTKHSGLALRRRVACDCEFNGRGRWTVLSKL